ncbi:hypothetical protein [Rhodovulum sp. PH10]|uniref:hypothetical protein n=1 Tax=Rhodovulum sp. PH10 TaxID=1187851 RepID=UPI0012FC9464|nr:hypothetical protein [Rhodovulum sp. PH10]
MGEAVAVECTHIAAAFEAMLGAALAQLMLQFAARLAAVELDMPRELQVSALAALRQERDAALAILRATIRAGKRAALAAAMMRARGRPKCSEPPVGRTSQPRSRRPSCALTSRRQLSS